MRRGGRRESLGCRIRSSSVSFGRDRVRGWGYETDLGPWMKDPAGISDDR